MSFCIASSRVVGGLAVMEFDEQAADESSVDVLPDLWARLRDDASIVGVVIVGRARSFHGPTRAVAPSPSALERVPLTPPGPKATGLLKPIGIGLHCDTFDEALPLVAEADIVVGTPDVRIADTSAARGGVAIYAAALGRILPQHEVNRLGLLGVPGALSADRALELGLLDAVAEREALVAELERSIRRLITA